MKKVLYMFAAVALLFASCTKEQDLSGYATADQLAALQAQVDALDGQIQTQFYQFNVTFPAVNEGYFSEVTYNGLSGKVKKRDALLLYMYWDSEWMQMPFCYGNNTLNYTRTDNGVLHLSWGRSLYQTFTQEAMTTTIRAIVIPEEAVAKGTTAVSYEDALSFAGLTEADVQNI